VGAVNARSAERLADEVDTAATTSRFSGVVTLRVDAEPVLERAYGLADRANGLENTTRTRFGTASATKTFTACNVPPRAATITEILDGAFLAAAG
jgi:CubicO group peptidase (beta-lactamase class C family)